MLLMRRSWSIGWWRAEHANVRDVYDESERVKSWPGCPTAAHALPPSAASAEARAGIACAVMCAITAPSDSLPAHRIPPLSSSRFASAPMLRRFMSGRSSTGVFNDGGLGAHANTEEKAFVQVPPGVGPGDMLRVELPDGKTVDLLLPANAAPGTTLEVERTVDISVAIPKGAKPGQTLSVSHAGVSLAFTVPKGAKAGSTIKLAVPASELRKKEEDEEDGDALADVKTVSAKLPASWDGYSAVQVEVDGRALLFQAPPGAKPGDEVALDLPPAGQRVRLTFTVPFGVAGGDVVGIHTPSGHLKFVTLPPDAAAGAPLTVRIADEPDAETPSGGVVSGGSGGGGSGSGSPRPMRLALQARSLGGSGGGGGSSSQSLLMSPKASGRNKRAQPIFTVLSNVDKVEVDVGAIAVQ